jgi:hypothetical protein
MSAPPTPAPAGPRPDVVAILDHCRRATATWPDTSIVGQPEVSDRGVRVRLVSWPRTQAAAFRLRTLGYRVEIRSRPLQREVGEALLVTGWHAEALRNRLARVTEWLCDLEAAHRDLADKALNAYRFYIDEQGLSEEDARLRVLRDYHRDAAAPSDDDAPPQRLTLVQRVCPPIADEEIARSDGELRELLTAISAGQRAVHGLFSDYPDTIDAAIQMFREYRDRHSTDEDTDDELAARALIEVAEGCAARYDVAEADVEAALAVREA